MTGEGFDWQAFMFFAFNAVFTAFNARIAWMNWRREERKTHPIVEVSVEYDVGDIFSLEIAYLPTASIAWAPSSARLRAAGPGRVANPLQHFKYNHDNEPWVPTPIEVDWASMTHQVRLFVKARPGREVLWFKFPKTKWPKRIVVDLIFESNEPQPRRYKLKVKRAIPAFKAVIAT